MGIAQNLPPLLNKFSDKFCRLPKELWKDQQVPANCVERIATQLKGILKKIPTQ
jgi:hypothetical protein